MSSIPIFKDRVMETSTTTGTGTYTLAGAVAGYQSFSAIATTKTCFYCAMDVDGNGNASGGWEVGRGTYTSGGTTLSRDGILTSTNGNAPVSWAAGTRRILLVTPAALFGAQVNVMSFGATGDGSTDDTTAIQAAIDSLPVTGGTVIFPVPTDCYKITASLTIGDGTSSAVSTKQGVILKGEGLPRHTIPFTGYLASSGVRIKWVNASGDAMIKIRGPLQGWGIQNITLDGNSQATYGMQVTSCQFGDSHNLHIKNCVTVGLLLNTFATGGFSGVSNTDCTHNAFKNVSILIPDVTNCFGLLLQNAQENPLTANVCYTVFDNLEICGPGTATNVFFIYLQVCDGNVFRHVHLINTSASNKALILDYSVTGSANMPSDNIFDDIDFGSSTTGIANSGVPSAATENKIVGIHAINGIPGDPGLANLAWGYTQSNP